MERPWQEALRKGTELVGASPYVRSANAVKSLLVRRAAV